MMEGIMDRVRIMTALGRTGAISAVRVFRMLVPTSRQSRLMAFAAFNIGLAVMGMGCTDAGRFSPPGAAGGPLPSFAPVVAEVMPAVVNVSAVQRMNKATAEAPAPLAGRMANKFTLRDLPPSVFDELLRRLMRPRDRTGGGSGSLVTNIALGSGFLIDPSGYVVTDNHVVENAEKATIIVQDAMEYPARIIGRDPMTDLALLKLDATQPFSSVHWGNSDSDRVGDWVLAIGNPFGLDNTVSSGIISGTGRDIHTGPYDDFLQIDAAMNRGNSGGPTFDLHGNVIGINTAIYSPNGGSVGIGFAIPANRPRPIVEQLRAQGRVVRGWLGVQIQPVTLETAEQLGLERAAGALVVKVGAGSPAAAAGFQPGDVILSINGQEIRRMRDLAQVVAEMPIGHATSITVWRSKTALSLQPVVGEMPTDPAIAELDPGRKGGRRSEGASNGSSPVSVLLRAI